VAVLMLGQKWRETFCGPQAEDSIPVQMDSKGSGPSSRLKTDVA
jgi:hypothetical protein